MPRQTRTGRRRDAAALVGCVLVLLVITPQLTGMIDLAWNQNALSYNLIHTLVRVLGVDIDVAVVFPAGVCIGWLVLFLLDRSKRIQSIVLIFTGSGFIYLLAEHGRWVQIEWGSYLSLLSLGIVLGLVSGGIHRLVTDAHREFPAASAGLYAVASFVTVASLFESHLSYVSPLVAYPNLAPVAVSPQLVQTEGLLIHAVSTVLFMVVLSTFVQYSDRRDVLLITPDDSAESAVLAGLFDQIRKQRTDRTITSDVASRLSDAVGELRMEQEPMPIDERVRLRFKRPGLLSRWVEVVADGHRATQLGRPPYELLRRRQRSEIGKRLRQFGVRVISALLPVPLSRFASADRRLVERINSVDVLLLTVRTPDTLGDSPEYLDVYRELADIFSKSNSTKVVLAALDADQAFDAFEKDRGIEPDLSKSSFRDYLRRNVFAVRSEVVPLSRTEGEDPLDGSRRLLTIIEQT